MPKLTIDGMQIEVEPGTSVLQACEQLGIEIPRFCYHERLSVPANCRMCLVEMERSPKPIASCAMPATDNMVIHTQSEKAKAARRGVMEFLLINHPLDCPICDQGGECDLQDQSMAYGFDRGRYGEAKRAVQEKELGPLIRTAMTRCIHCTRCVRFCNEIAGVPVLGGTGRGEDMEIGTYVEAAITSELSGNLVDICPVGALTNKPYAFNARPWELRKTETIDVMDAVGSNIRVDTRGRDVLRILPRLNEDVNEEWIADKTRHVCDGLRRQRLDRPYVRQDGKLRPATWKQAFEAIAARLHGVPGSRIAALAGDLCDAESMLTLKELMTGLGSPHLDCRQDGATFDTAARAGYLFNTSIAGIEQADRVLLIGTNPRREAPIINARLRKRYLMGGLTVGVIGPRADLSYPYDYLGAGPQTLQEVADGSHAFCQALQSAKAPMLILGAGPLARPDGAAVQALVRTLAERHGLVREGWNGFNVLHTAAARVGGLELGFLPGPDGHGTHEILAGCRSGEIEAVYLLGADEIDPAALGEAFVIYQGHHGDRGAHRADVILPGAAYTEKNGLYVNTEGRPQLALMAVFPPGEAKEDWKILRALADRLGVPLGYDTLAALRSRLYQVNPIFRAVDTVTPAPWATFGREGALDATVSFASPIENYYMTDPISRASAVMAQCTDWFATGTGRKTGTHG